MIRVVIDTNVLVSALLKPASLPGTILALVHSGRIQLCISEQIFAEYEDVLHRPHLKRDPAIVAQTLLALRELGLWVTPNECGQACLDPSDNIFIECAEAAGVDYLVTGNKRHFPDCWKRTNVLGSRQLIEILAK